MSDEPKKRSWKRNGWWVIPLVIFASFSLYRTIHELTYDRAPISGSLRTVPTHMIAGKELPRSVDRCVFWLAYRLDEMSGSHDWPPLPDLWQRPPTRLVADDP
jgi:hypothetical protein